MAASLSGSRIAPHHGAAGGIAAELRTFSVPAAGHSAVRSAEPEPVHVVKGAVLIAADRRHIISNRALIPAFIYFTRRVSDRFPLEPGYHLLKPIPFRSFWNAGTRTSA